MTLASSFLQSAVKRLGYYKELGDKTFTQLNDNDFYYQPNEESNSIAIIIQHMAGNMLSRWTNFLTADGEKEWRNRDNEFEQHELNKQQLLELWEKGWACCITALNDLTAEDLLKTIHIRGEGLLVVDAINRQLAHYPHHVGQIIYAAKIILGPGWHNLSIAKKQSHNFNEQMKKEG